jgi:hypothetical protein
MLSMIAWRFDPRPETRTAMRVFFMEESFLPRRYREHRDHQI